MVYLNAILKYPNDEACCLSMLLIAASDRLAHNFGNLDSIANWEKLFHHLCQQATSFENIAPSSNVFQGDLVNLTTLLFQALSPIRFGFLEGQARIVAVSHYLRQFIPSKVSSSSCIRSVRPYLNDATWNGKLWSPQLTGSKAQILAVVQRPTPQERCRLSLLRDLHKMSYSICAEIRAAETYHFSK